MTYRFVNFCPKCYYGVLKAETSAYFMLPYGHPLVVPDVNVLRCDICRHVVMNDDRYAEFIDFRLANKHAPKMNKHGGDVSGQVSKKQK